jgi:hypothetical protein
LAAKTDFIDDSLLLILWNLLKTQEGPKIPAYRPVRFFSITYGQFWRDCRNTGRPISRLRAKRLPLLEHLQKTIGNSDNRAYRPVRQLFLTSLPIHAGVPRVLIHFVQTKCLAEGLRSAWYSSKRLVEGNHRDINVSLAFGDCIFRLKLSALGIQQ